EGLATLLSNCTDTFPDEWDPEDGQTMRWMSLRSKLELLPQLATQTPVEDWQVVIAAPLRLENALPCAAHFQLLQPDPRYRVGQPRGSLTLRQQGYIASNSTICVYSIDMRLPVYLSLLPEGDWEQMGDPVHICGGLSTENAETQLATEIKVRRHSDPE
ncbi:hypothetical protein CYMTET_35874, partial [Cymbomonas tetramitiformis]